jgi:hypothetical protein
MVQAAGSSDLTPQPPAGWGSGVHGALADEASVDVDDGRVDSLC